MAAFWPARHKRRNKPGHGDKKLDSDVSGSNKSDSNCTHTRHTADKYKILQAQIQNILKAQNTKYYKRKIQNTTSTKYKVSQAQNTKYYKRKIQNITSAKYKMKLLQRVKFSMLTHAQTIDVEKKNFIFATLAENENYFAV